MPTIEKNDIVRLADCTVGRVVQVIKTNRLRIYKIEKMASREVTYLEGSLIQLCKQSSRNFFISAITEVGCFLLYIASTCAGRFGFMSDCTDNQVGVEVRESRLSEWKYTGSLDRLKHPTG
jgi:hypothetical protein